MYLFFVTFKKINVFVIYIEWNNIPYISDLPNYSWNTNPHPFPSKTVTFQNKKTKV